MKTVLAALAFLTVSVQAEAGVAQFPAHVARVFAAIDQSRALAGRPPLTDAVKLDVADDRIGTFDLPTLAATAPADAFRFVEMRVFLLEYRQADVRTPLNYTTDITRFLREEERIEIGRIAFERLVGPPSSRLA